jgi:hypothetical protein
MLRAVWNGVVLAEAPRTIRLEGNHYVPEMRRLAAHLAQAGLRLVQDERHRFGYRLDGHSSAAEFLSSLYFPGLPAARYRLAGTYLRLLAGLGAEMPVPLRRIVAERPA